MKQLAIRSLGWGVGAMALIQLPVLASNPTLKAASVMDSASTINSVSGQTLAQPQLLAVALGVRSLRQGDSGTDVRILQRYLSRNGLYPYEIDGVYGVETTNAVSTYQRIRDLPATGLADEATLVDMEFDFLQETAPVTAAPVAAAPTNAASALVGRGGLVPGSSGSDVIALQQRLNGFGIPLFVDGVYGFETEQAVRTYQRVQGLNVSGVADNDTLKNMGFSTPAASSNRYISAVIANESLLSEVQRYFPEAYVDRVRGGSFINIGGFADRSPAEARVDAAAARGFNTRVLYRRRGLFR